MKTIEFKASARYISDLELPVHKRMDPSCYIDWANFGAREVLEWISVDEELPEETKSLLDNSIEDVERTVKVLVMTDNGNVTDNRRIKMAVGEKEWKWFMGYEGETIVKWRIL